MEAIVLYSIPSIRHLISMVELGKLILTSNPSLSIHILVTTPPYNAGDIAQYIAGITATVPSIIFHHLPPITLPPEFVASYEANHLIDSRAGLELVDGRGRVQEQLQEWASSKAQMESFQAETTKIGGRFMDEFNKGEEGSEKDLEEKPGEVRKVRVHRKPSWLNGF